jgi:hypothetical protein|nr:MAG TPA: Protein of unknown function (DUF669) [Podoviridae sp. ctgHy19]
MSRKLKVDMTGVESFTRCPEGQFPAKIVKIEECTIQGSGDDGLKVQFEVTGGSGKGCKVFETLSLGEKALWKLKMLLEALGMKATGKLTIDLDKLLNKACAIEVIHDEYNGQKRAKISQYLKLSELDEEDEVDEDDDDDIDDDEDEEEVKPTKKVAAKKKPKKQPEPEEDDEDDEDEDEDEDDEEEEEPAPKSKKSSKKAPVKKATKASKKSKKDDEDDWEEDDD